MTQKVHIGLSKIKFEPSLGFSFSADEYMTPGEHHVDFLVFKDFLSKKVLKSLYVFGSVDGMLGNRSTESTRPSMRKLSMEEGNRFCEKTVRAIKAYQLLNRRSILHYGQKHFSWASTTPEQSKSLHPGEVSKIMTNDFKIASTPDFSKEFGLLGPATIAVMLGYRFHRTHINPDWNKGLVVDNGVAAYGSMVESDQSNNFFSSLSSRQKRRAEEFDRIYSLRKEYQEYKKNSPAPSEQDKKNFLDAKGVKYQFMEDLGDTTFSLIEQEADVRISYTPMTDTPDDGEILVVESVMTRKLYDKVYKSSPTMKFSPATASSLLDSLRTFVERRRSLEGATGSSVSRSGMTAKKAVDILSKPQPSAQGDDPWIGTGEVKNFVHIYVDSDYTLEEEAELYARFGGKVATKTPPLRKRKQKGLKKDDAFVKEIQFALLVNGVLDSFDVPVIESEKERVQLRVEESSDAVVSLFKESGVDLDSARIAVTQQNDQLPPDAQGDMSFSFDIGDADKEGHTVPVSEFKNRPTGHITYLEYLLYVDGKFGQGTESAVKSFQSNHGLKSDGVVGTLTYRKIYQVHGDKLSKYGFESIKDTLGARAEVANKKHDYKYLTRDLSRKALQKVFAYYKKETTWKLNLADPEINDIYPGKYNPTLTQPVTLSINDDTLFDFEDVDAEPFRTIHEEIDLPESFCTVRSQLRPLSDIMANLSNDVEAKRSYWATESVADFFIPPTRPGGYFMVEYVIDRKKLDLVLSKTDAKVVDAVDAGIMAFETAAVIYDKVSKFLEDPSAAYELAEEKVSKAIDDYASAKIEAISEYKRDAIKNAGKNTRNAWKKLRKKKQKDRRNRLLKERAAKNASQIQSRDVQLLGGTAKFETRLFRKKIDKVANKMIDLNQSFQDMKKEQSNIQATNKDLGARGYSHKKKEDPFQSYSDFLNMKPELDLKKDAERLREIPGAMETFLKLNGQHLEDKFNRFLEFDFAKVRDRYGNILGAKIKSIYFVGQKPADYIDEQVSTAAAFAGSEESFRASRRKLEHGFDALIKKSPFNDHRIMSYFAQMNVIDKELFKSAWGSRCGEYETLPVMDFISKYVYPAPGISSLTNDATPVNKKTSSGKPVITVKENIEENVGLMFSQLKTSAQRLTEQASVTAQNVDSLVQFKKGKTYDANDLLPLGELCTWEEITQKFINTFDFKSYWCEFSACLPDIPWPIVIDLTFDIPKLPKLPTLKQLRIIFDQLYISLVEMLVRFFCTLINKLLDLIRFPNCDEIFEAALFGAASLVNAIQEHDSMETPVPIGSYDISSQFLRGVDQSNFNSSKTKVQKKMLNSLTSYGIPAELLSDPDSGVNGSSMTDMINDLSALMRPTELTSLLRGNATPEVLTIIVNYIDMNIPALSEYLSSENSIQDFFSNLGGLIDVEVLNRIDKIPQILAENRFCPETVDARSRIIMGDLSEDQLRSAINAHNSKSTQTAEAVRAMMTDNPIASAMGDLYNPGDPNAIISDVPAPMVEIIESTAKSIFEVPKFSFIADVSRYTDLLYDQASRPLEYEDPEFNLDIENKALEAIEILTKNEAEIRNALTGANVVRKWRLRERLYEKFHYDVFVVEKKFKTQRRKRNRQGSTKLVTTVKLYPEVSDELMQQLKSGALTDSCGGVTDLNENGRTEFHFLIKRIGSYNSDLSPGVPSFENLQLELVNQVFKLSNYVPDFLPTGASLMVKPQKEDEDGILIPNAPILRRDDGTAIKSSLNMNDVSESEKTGLIRQITDSIVTRITELQNAVMRHLEVNMSDKNDSAILPEIRKYYDRSEETRRERGLVGDEEEFFRVVPSATADGFSFELSLPKRFQSSLVYEEVASEGDEDLYKIVINDQVLMKSSENFYGCDILPQEYARPPGVSSLAKKGIYVDIVRRSMVDHFKRYQRSEGYNAALSSLRRAFTRDLESPGQIADQLHEDSYNSTFEMFFEEIMDQMSDSRIFNDPEYIEKLDVRIRGAREYDKNGCLVRSTKGLIDFEEIVKSASSRVLSAFNDPSFHPSKMEFNAGSMGPFEKGIIHSAIYLMVNFLLIEFALRGGIAFSSFSPNALFGKESSGANDNFLHNYLVNFISNSLSQVMVSANVAFPESTKITDKTLLYPFRDVFMNHCVEYVRVVSPSTVSTSDKSANQKSAISYIVNEVIKEGQLIDMIEGLFHGTEQEKKPFVKTFLENSQILSIPEETTPDGMWKLSGVEEPENAIEKGRFLLQKYIRVTGPAASRDLSQYTFSEEFLSKKDEILQRLREVDPNQDLLVDDPVAVADRIDARIDVLEEMEPLPGAADDDYRTPLENEQTEVVSIEELNSYLRNSYQGSFNEELCNLLGLIYTEDPENPCFLMPEAFTRFPGKLIKKNFKRYKIDRGFTVRNQGQIEGIGLRFRYRDWVGRGRSGWKDEEELLAYNANPPLDQAGRPMVGGFNDRNVVRSRDVRFSYEVDQQNGDRGFFNDVFDQSLLSDANQPESSLYSTGIFSKLGRAGQLGALVHVEDADPEYLMLEEDVCKISSDFGKEGITKIFEGYSAGGFVAEREDLLLTAEMKNFSESFTPIIGAGIQKPKGPETFSLLSMGQGEKLKQGVVDAVPFMDSAFNTYQNSPDLIPLDMLTNRSNSLQEGGDYSYGSSHPKIEDLGPRGMRRMEQNDNPQEQLFGWKKGKITEEEFNQYRSMENLSDGLRPRLQNDIKILGPNDVYEEWTHYLIEDPGYVFGHPGESLHHPESMGCMMDPYHFDGTDAPRDEYGDDWSYVHRHWVDRAFLECCRAIEDKSLLTDESKKQSRVGQYWGWGFARFKRHGTGQGRNTDRYNPGHGRYDQVFRFNHEKRWDGSKEKATEHRRRIRQFPNRAAIMVRPLGYQNESYEHEKTNELGANEYASPLKILVTRIDYKIGDTVLHSDVYMGSEYNDGGILAGSDLRASHTENEYRSLMLSEAINRLMMEWVENNTSAINLYNGEVSSDFLRDNLRKRIEEYVSMYVSNGLGPTRAVNEEDKAILFTVCTIGTIKFYLENFLGMTLPSTVDYATPQRWYNALGRGQFAFTPRGQAQMPSAEFRATLMILVADIIANGFSDLVTEDAVQAYIDSELSDISQFPDNFAPQQGVGAIDARAFLELGRALQETPAIELILDTRINDQFQVMAKSLFNLHGNNEDFGLRPLSRTYQWKKQDLTAPFDFSRYKTNMLTIPKVYSAAALIAGNLNEVTHLQPPWRQPDFEPIVFGHPQPRVSSTRSKFGGYSLTQQCTALFNKSNAVDIGASAWGDQRLFRFSDPEQTLEQKLAVICNKYTEGVLNQRTYEGFWGYTSSPNYLEGMSFHTLVSYHKDYGYRMPYARGADIVREGATSNRELEEYDWSIFLQVQDTFPAVCDLLGGNTGGDDDYGTYENEYALERLPYPQGFQGAFAGRDLPPVGNLSDHYLIGDGYGLPREEEIQNFISVRGDHNKSIAEMAILSQDQELLTGFRAYMINRGIGLVFKADSDERKFWNTAGDQLATPRDEGDTMANYGGQPLNPAGIFEELNAVLKEELSTRLQNIIEGSNYQVGLRMVQILPKSVSDSMDNILNSLGPQDPLRLALELLMVEERIVKVKLDIPGDAQEGISYALPIVHVEEGMDRCNLNWRNISVSAGTMIPELLDMLSADERTVDFIEKSFPLQRLSLLSGLYSIMALSTKDEFSDFMMPSKLSISGVFSSILTKTEFEGVPSGVDLWMMANGYMTSTGPKPDLDLMGQMGDFFTQLILNALNTPIILIKNLAGGLDPAYKSMMKSQGPGSKQVKSLNYSSISANGLESKMSNGVNCDGEYVPVNLGFPRDLAANLVPIPNRDFFRALKKFAFFIRRKKRGGVFDSYGDFLGPFGAIALALPDLRGDTPAAVAARARQTTRTPPEQCEPAEIVEISENNTEEDN